MSRARIAVVILCILFSLGIGTAANNTVINSSEASGNVSSNTSSVINVTLDELNLTSKNESENYTTPNSTHEMNNTALNETLPEDNQTVANNTSPLPTTLNESNATVANNKSITEQLSLASSVNGQSINTAYIKQYLTWNNNFSSLSYSRLRDGSKETFTLKTNQESSQQAKGYRVDNKLYAVHLIACDRNSRSCAFRINGVPTGKLQAENTPGVSTSQSSFTLDETYSLKIKNIQWGYCDGRRFCNYYYEAYDKIEVEIQ